MSEAALLADHCNTVQVALQMVECFVCTTDLSECREQRHTLSARLPAAATVLQSVLGSWYVQVAVSKQALKLAAGMRVDGLHHKGPCMACSSDAARATAARPAAVAEAVAAGAKLVVLCHSGPFQGCFEAFEQDISTVGCSAHV
jgi:hypothetical protein